jgi:hypothetical protein
MRRRQEGCVSAFLLGLGFRADMGTCVRKLVVLKLIDACEDDGTRIFPAISTVARAAQCSPRQVQREIRAFLDAGLLRLVREGGKGPRSTNEYAMDLDVLGRIAREGWDAFTAGARGHAQEAVRAGGPNGEDENRKGDTVSPFDDGDKGDTGDAKRVTPETDKGDNVSHPTPPDSSLDPSEERGAGARDGQEGKPEAEAGSEPESRDDPRKFEARVKRLAERNAWPNWANSSTGWSVAQFARLTDAERAEAERHGAAYVRHCGRGALSIGTYFAERKWLSLPADALETAAPPPVEEKPFGRAGMAQRFAMLLAGPTFTALRLTGFEEQLVAAGKADRGELMREKLAKQGFPRVLERDGRRAVAVEPAVAALGELFVKARRGDEVYEDWRHEHRLRGWPWLPEWLDWAWLPTGTPQAALASLDAALKAGANGDARHDRGGGREAAE